jgi:cell division septal protein FtsQ
MRWPSFRRRAKKKRRAAAPSRAATDMGHRLRPDAKRSRRIGWWLLGVSLVTLMGGLSQSPRLLRRMDTFRVRQVEVRGTRYLDPDEVLATSGLGERSSVFDSPDAWIAALERHPMVESARIERRLPSTVRIVVRETRPVALVHARTLVPVDGTGRVLPLAPEAARLDLPILIGDVEVDARGMIADPDARAAVVALDRLQSEEPALAAAVSEFGGGGALRLLLRLGEPTLALLPLEASDTRLRELRRTLDHLATNGELHRVMVVDGRFEGQVVVSLNTAKPI